MNIRSVIVLPSPSLGSFSLSSRSNLPFLLVGASISISVDEVIRSAVAEERSFVSRLENTLIEGKEDNELEKMLTKRESLYNVSAIFHVVIGA